MSLSTKRWLLEHEGIPPAPRLTPLVPPRGGGPAPRLSEFGHLRPVLREGLLAAYLRWAIEEGDDYVVWLGPTPHVVVVRPESALRVLQDEHAFVRNPEPTRELFGRGLLRMAGPPWRRRRERFTPSLSGVHLGELVDVVQQETGVLLNRWSGTRGRLFKPTRELSWMMLRILGRFLFGFSFEAERHGGLPLHRSLIALSTDSVLRHLFPAPLVPLAKRRELARARRTLRELCTEILERGGDTPFMDALRRGLAEGALDRETALDELRTFLVAGHETSATALAWTLAALAQHPELAAGVRAEASRAEAARRPEDLNDLVHTERWIKETLRLFPAVPISVQQSACSGELGRLRLHVGTRVDLCSFVLHRLPSLWPQPERFDPQRFELPPAPGSYLPFLAGPHVCLGRRFAMLELSIATARLAAAFEFELPEGPPKLNLRLSLHPEGFRLRLR